MGWTANLNVPFYFIQIHDVSTIHLEKNNRSFYQCHWKNTPQRKIKKDQRKRKITLCVVFKDTVVKIGLNL